MDSGVIGYVHQAQAPGFGSNIIASWERCTRVGLDPDGHGLATGGSRSGKSSFVFAMLEQLIARGDLDSILYLCRAEQAGRHRADLLADIEEIHGFRAVGVAKGSISPTDGHEEWSYLGFVPVKATRTPKSRREEPAAYRYVPVWDWQLRALHWTAFFAYLLSPSPVGSLEADMSPMSHPGKIRSTSVGSDLHTSLLDGFSCLQPFCA